MSIEKERDLQGEVINSENQSLQTELSPEQVAYVIDDDEFYSIHEEMFKMGQPMLANEDMNGYKDRVQALWEKRREDLQKERMRVVGGEDMAQTTEVPNDVLDEAIQEVYKNQYFSRRGHLSDDLFEVSKGADPDSEEPVRLFESVSGEIGEHFDAHGIDKGDQVNDLLKLLSHGVDQTRDFYTAPFEITDEKKQAMAAAVGTAGGTAYKGGLAVVTGGYGESIHEGGIKHVFVNDIFKELIPLLAQRFPGVQVHALSEQKQVLEDEVHSAIKKSK